MNQRENTRRLFEVIGENPQARLSPYCWRSRMALEHKALRYVSDPWHITEKDRIAQSGGTTAPVLEDGGHWVRDSWLIALYLEDNYPQSPLFNGAQGRAKSLFLNNWVDCSIHPLIFRAVIAEQFPLTAECDKAYYRERTLTKFGLTLAEHEAQTEAALHAARQVLKPLELTLKETPFLGGVTPDYGDYILFGTFQWIRVVSTSRFWSPDAALQRWFDVLLDAFDGVGRRQAPRNAL